MFDSRALLDHLESVRPVGPWPSGFPERDHTRSPASAAVGGWAAECGLFGFHFEHRFELDLPQAWVEPSMMDVAEPPQWTDGTLPERKYQSFRHDLMVGSFHPGHRGKWSSHELCHGLVGFAWNRSADRFFHATAGRLAELLPVVLYYFLDEIGLQRCPLHAGGGALYRAFCPRCEEVAARRKFTPEDHEHAQLAARFMERELTAIAKSRRTGMPIAHRFGSLDLCSDGLAYARAHGARLESEAMERFSAFLVAGGGHSPTLDDLEARVVSVWRAFSGEALESHAPSGDLGRARWARQDLAFRLLTVWCQADGEAAHEILDVLEHIDDDPRTRWDALCEDFVLPSSEHVFSVGYDGASMRSQLADGLQSVVPLTVALAEDLGVDLAVGFVDRIERANLGDRFAQWLDETHPDLAPLARFETAIRTVKADPIRASLGAGPGILCDGVRIVRGPTDLARLAERIDGGAVCARLEGGRIELLLDDREPWGAALCRADDGQLVFVELDDRDAADLARGHVDPDIAGDLASLGLTRPERYSSSST